MVINVCIVVDKKVNNLGHEDLLLAGGSRKWGDTGGIPSLCSGRVCRLVGALSLSKLNAKCSHEVSCSVDSAASPINSRSHRFCITGEIFYDAEKLLNLTNICEHLP